jgi:hypothetical protein
MVNVLASSVVDRLFESRSDKTKEYRIGIWIREWLLCNTNSAIFQLYDGENKLIFQWDDDEVRFVLDQHA